MNTAAADRGAQFEQARLDLFAAQGFDGHATRIAHTDGRETYAFVRGSGACPTVLVHGGVTAAEEWSGITALLPGPLVMPDRPGSGLSSPARYRGAAAMRAEAARWLNEFVDGLAVDRINLVGCSMGGLFSIAFATAHPERVRRLILAGSAPGIFYKFPPFYHLLASRMVGRRMVAMPAAWDRETYRKRMMSQLVVHPEAVPDALLDVIRAGSALPGTADTRFIEMHSMVTLRGLRRELRMRDELAALDLPTLLLWGPHDHFARPAVAEDLVSRMDSAQLTLLEDAGHIPHFDQPARAADAINSFIA